MTKKELCTILSENIKKYRKGVYTQEMLAEKTGLSVQQINGIECGRKFVSTESLLKIAEALNVEVFQLFIPSEKESIKIETTPENEIIRQVITEEVIKKVRTAVEKTLKNININDL